MIVADLTITVEAVAWYGAIVATVGLLIAVVNTATSVYTVRRDRTRLRLSILPNMMTTEPPPGINSTGPFIFITAANVGRRPIFLTGFPWFTQRGSKKILLIKGQWQPSSELSENTSATYLALQDQLSVTNLKAICVKDQTGRVWSQKVTIGEESDGTQPKG